MANIIEYLKIFIRKLLRCFKGSSYNYIDSKEIIPDDTESSSDNAPKIKIANCVIKSIKMKENKTDIIK